MKTIEICKDCSLGRWKGDSCKYCTLQVQIDTILGELIVDNQFPEHDVDFMRAEYPPTPPKPKRKPKVPKPYRVSKLVYTPTRKAEILAKIARRRKSDIMRTDHHTWKHL